MARVSLSSTEAAHDGDIVTDNGIRSNASRACRTKQPGMLLIQSCILNKIKARCSVKSPANKRDAQRHQPGQSVKSSYVSS